MLKTCLISMLAAMALAQGGAEQATEKARQRPVTNGPNMAGIKRPQAGNAVSRFSPTNAQQQGLQGKRPQGGCKPCCDSSSSTSHWQQPANPCQGDCNRVNVMPDAGFYSFPYAGSNTFSPRSFYICTDKTLILSVTNCFCQGDYFEVFDNGQPILLTLDGQQSAQYPPNYTPGLPVTGCVPVNDPSTCLASPYFNHGSAVLNPGTHLITILVGASWYTGGAGFLRVDTACLINGLMQPCCMAEDETGAACPKFIVA